MRLSVINEDLYSLNKKYIGHMNNGIKVYTVDGEYVRTYFDNDFAGAGHSLAYKGIIPKNEIWVENTLTSDKDIKAIILHELVEHMMMSYFNMSYLEAHRRANKIEHTFRNKFKLHP